MTSRDTLFAGSIPELYDRHLGPLLFVPYAADLAARVRAQPAARVLEVAAGTGIVTRMLAEALPPDATIVATDLNGGMLAHAAKNASGLKVTWREADAMSLPFGGAEFDLVVCQFGAMFFPDRAKAYREAHRVLAPGGRFLFSMWASLEHNPLARVVSDTAAAAFPEDPPNFIARTPHGHGDTALTEREIREAGFSSVRIDTVDLIGRVESALGAATGFCQGTPLRNEIDARDPGRLAQITKDAARAIAASYGDGPIEAPLRAYVYDARK